MRKIKMRPESEKGAVSSMEACSQEIVWSGHWLKSFVYRELRSEEGPRPSDTVGMITCQPVWPILGDWLGETAY